KSLLWSMGGSMGIDVPPNKDSISPEKISQFLNMVQDDLVKVDVYFQSLNLNVIEQQPKRDLKSLISDLGGILGIYLGLCIIVLIEIFEFLFLLVYNAAAYFCCPSSAIRPVTVENPKARREVLSKRSRSLSPRPNLQLQPYTKYSPSFKEMAAVPVTMPQEYMNPRKSYENPFTF
ncbi:unnamed protein product, partial [Darwinula stevensoni]